MYDIDESAAGSVDWTEKVKGFDTTDEVRGGIGGVDNIPITLLALRTRNLHLRNIVLESKIVANGSPSSVETFPQVINVLNGWDPNNRLIDFYSNVIFSLLGKANRSGDNITNPNQWLQNLGITHRVVMAGVSSNIIVGNIESTYSVYLISTINYNPSKHTILIHCVPFGANNVLCNMVGDYTNPMLLSMITVRMKKNSTGSEAVKIYYSIIEKI